MIIVADNLHVVQPAIARALQTFDPQPVRDMVRRCVQAGAQIIDINCGPLGKAPERQMDFLLETVRSVCDLPVLLDTTNPAAMRAGLRAAPKGRAIINGFSLEPAKIEHILPLAVEFETDIIGYLLHPDSRVPLDAEEMMTLAVSVFEQFSSTGLPAQRLIIDPVITPLSWQEGARHNRAVLSVLRHLPDLLGAPVRSIAGLSNLVSGPMPAARKIALEQAFLPMLAAAGLSMVMANVLHTPTMQTARLCNVLLDDQVFAGIP